MPNERIVIIGASLAGAKAAETLRREGFDGEVLLLGEEPLLPYERPPLSKAYLRGEDGLDSALVHDAAFYSDHQIELLTGTRATAIDTTTREVTIEPGGRVRYDRLLLATGAAPRQLPMVATGLAGVHQLRTAPDSDALRDALLASSRVVVIGAGWIGCEVAASARQLGKQVAMIDIATVPLQRVLGDEVGAMFGELHRDHGVELHLGKGIAAVQGTKRFESVLLDDGQAIEGDLVVIGVGVAPRAELGAQAGLEIDNGIVTDQFLETSAAGIFAAGDVANAFHPHYGRRVRLEHWSAALKQGPVAAKNLLGQQLPYDEIPYFFSDQYDLGMEYAGLATEWDEVLFRGDVAGREVIVFWLKEGVVVAGMNVNVWDVSDDIQALVRSRRAMDRSALADPGTELSSLLA